MACVSTACRIAARLSARQLRQDAKIRGFCTSSPCLVAQIFTMPALSPTMAEGNIAKWNFKEGDSFTAGDVLLEIETDKACMDVEAQDDGIVAKIILGDGSKGIKVGTRIGVLAEIGDDLSSLELSPEKNIVETAPEKHASKKKTESFTNADALSSVKQNHAPTLQKAPGVAKKQKYPLLPSVEHLIRLHGLDHSAIDRIIPSGPHNRLLKGDVLSFLGLIEASYPTELSTKIKRLSHLDLSNIKVKVFEPARASPAASVTESQKPEVMVELEVPISFKQVYDVQERIKTTLGVHIPENVFITRATDFANQNLPRPRSYKPSADELFNHILGLKTDTPPGGFRDKFCPTATPESPQSFTNIPSKPKNIDIIDFLSGSNHTSPNSNGKAASCTSKCKPGSRTFNLTVPKADEERAQLFLSRIRTALESTPGNLVLLSR